MKKFSTIEKRFTNKFNKLRLDMARALYDYLIEKRSDIRFANPMPFTKDDGEMVFIDRIYTDYISVWIRYRNSKGEVWAMDFSVSFSMNERLKIFQMISNYKNI